MYLLPYSRAGVRTYVKHFTDPETNDKVGYVGTDPGLPMVVPAGSIACFSSVVFHRSGPNLTDRLRRAYIVQYSPDCDHDQGWLGAVGDFQPFLLDGASSATEPSSAADTVLAAGRRSARSTSCPADAPARAAGAPPGVPQGGALTRRAAPPAPHDAALARSSLMSFARIGRFSNVGRGRFDQSMPRVRDIVSASIVPSASTPGQAAAERTARDAGRRGRSRASRPALRCPAAASR